ncbi:MAG: alpha-amylase [Clostridia bacterium]|nr:alpha-amylase [Clostridia bacterium]
MDKNEIMLQGFEWNLPADGKHWDRLASMALSLHRAGVTSIWLPPAYKGTGGQEEVGYAVYDPYDLGEFNQCGSVRTKYGTADQYTHAIRTLHRFGIKTLSDMVMNHRMGAELCEKVKTHVVSTDNRMEIQPETQNSLLYTKFIFPGRKGRYSNFKWDSHCFTSVGYDKKDPDHHLFLIDGKSFAPDVDGELGNYDYLMGCDVDVNQRDVKKELIRWGMFTLNKTAVDGFRLDAVKHISAGFMEEWLSALRKKTGRELFTVGEYWSANLASLLSYLEEVHYSMSLFDVPLHYRFHEAAISDGSFDMGSLLNDTLSKTQPDHTVTFVDNHDTQPGQSLESFVSGWFKPAAYGIILLRGQGIPCVFWGDLYGMPYQNIPPVKNLRLLMRACRKYAYGQLYDYFDHHAVVGFTRIGDSEHRGSGLAFLCSNQGDGEKRMFVGQEHAGETFIALHGGFPPVQIDEEGCGTFQVSERDFSLYVPAKARSNAPVFAVNKDRLISEAASA